MMKKDSFVLLQKSSFCFFKVTTADHTALLFRARNGSGAQPHTENMAVTAGCCSTLMEDRAVDVDRTCLSGCSTQHKQQQQKVGSVSV